MNRGDSTQPGAPAVPGTAPDGKAGSGEGSDTALQALIRKRKQVESPDPPDGAAEQPPAR